MLFGAVETGGTKIIAAVLDENRELLDSIRFSTGEPGDAVRMLTDYFAEKNVCAIGIGSFGPVDINQDSETYGMVLDTPKKGWRNYPFLSELKKRIDVPMLIDTDVNCACLGEITYGAAKNLKNVIYITIGTGVGVGVCIEGETLKGMMHPEAGHILLRKHPDDVFKGICPYHSDCFEGLASGPAIAARTNIPAEQISADSKIWDIEADYIAQGITNYILTYSPCRIILGGGVMEQPHLFPLIRSKVNSYMNGYINTKQMNSLDDYIVPAGLLGKQGIIGTYCLARKAFSLEEAD